MKMEDILKNKGINYISEEYGVRKTMRFESYDGKKSIVGVEIYEDTLEIGVHVLKGSCPDVVQLFKALLSDKHVRRMIVAYQNKGRVKKYKMWYTSGMSGREDYFITFAYDVSRFLVKKLSIYYTYHVQENSRKDSEIEITECILVTLLNYYST